jgi:hypothetical protein
MVRSGQLRSSQSRRTRTAGRFRLAGRQCDEGMVGHDVVAAHAGQQPVLHEVPDDVVPTKCDALAGQGCAYDDGVVGEARAAGLGGSGLIVHGEPGVPVEPRGVPLGVHDVHEEVGVEEVRGRGVRPGQRVLGRGDGVDAFFRRRNESTARRARREVDLRAKE